MPAHATRCLPPPASCAGEESLLRAAWREHPLSASFRRALRQLDGNPFAFGGNLDIFPSMQARFRFPNGFQASLILFGDPSSPRSRFEIAPMLGRSLLHSCIRGRIPAADAAESIAAIAAASPSTASLLRAVSAGKPRSIRRLCAEVPASDLHLLGELPSLFGWSLSSDAASACRGGQCLAALFRDAHPVRDFLEPHFESILSDVLPKLSETNPDGSADDSPFRESFLPAAFAAGLPHPLPFPASLSDWARGALAESFCALEARRIEASSSASRAVQRARSGI